MGTIVQGVLGGIALFGLFSLLNAVLPLGLVNTSDVYNGSCTQHRLAAIAAVCELLLTVLSAWIGFQAITGGRPFRRAGTGWRTAWLTVSLFNLIPWPCSVLGQTYILGQTLNVHCYR